VELGALIIRGATHCQDDMGRERRMRGSSLVVTWGSEVAGCGRRRRREVVVVEVHRGWCSEHGG
jgi:hypothetical protein